MKAFLELLTKALLVSIQQVTGDNSVVDGQLFADEAGSQLNALRSEFTPEQFAIAAGAIAVMGTLQGGGIPRGTAEGLGRKALESIRDLTGELAAMEEAAAVKPAEPVKPVAASVTPAKPKV